MKELFIANCLKNDDLPITKRIQAYIHFFSQHGIDVEYQYSAKPSWIRVAYLSIIHGKTLLISMPPFRGFLLFLIPRASIILDIRDGWSIAMRSGYGGTSPRKNLKASIARLIERYIIRRSWITIACTPGLQLYLSDVAKKNVLFIPNGIDIKSLDIIQQPSFRPSSQRNPDELVFCCAGKFSEYGREKVVQLFAVLLNRYTKAKLLIELIGCDKEANRWTINYMTNLSDGRAKVAILPRMPRYELLQKMAMADYGISIIRDPNYDFGTKIYDYIALGLPIVNYFDHPNNFTAYFDACLDRPFCMNAKPPEIRREILIDSALGPYIKNQTI